MRLVKDGVFYGSELKPSIFQGRNRFYLAVKTESPATSVIQSMKSLVKIGSREDLHIIVSRALPGIGLEHQPQPPQELPRRSNTIYFLINSNSELWESVSKNKNLALYWNNAPADLDVELMVVGRS